MPLWDRRSRDVPGSSPGFGPRASPPSPGKRTLAEQIAPGAVQRKPTGSATAPSPRSPEPQDADDLAALIASPWRPGLASGLIDPVVRHLENLDMHRMLDELSDAVACDYGIALEVRCRSSPRLMAAIYAAELVDRGHVTPSHPAVQRAGTALDQVSSETQLQILAWMLQRRGVSVEATALVEGVLAMREQGADQVGAAGAGPMAGITGAGAGAPPAVEPGPWAPPGDQPGGLYIGNEAHKGIAAQYTLAHGSDLVMSNYYSIGSILGALKGLQHNPNPGALSETDLSLKPDIVNLSRLHLYEIKPLTAQALGAAKATLAVGIFGRAGIAMQLGPVGEPGTEGGIPAPDGVYMFWSPQPGVIVYQYRKGRLVPVPFAVGERSRVRRWRFELRPLTREEQQAAVTLTLGSALLLILMIALAPVGA